MEKDPIDNNTNSNLYSPYCIYDFKSNYSINDFNVSEDYISHINFLPNCRELFLTTNKNKMTLLSYELLKFQKENNEDGNYINLFDPITKAENNYIYCGDM
jgi:hypothetical protein